MQDKVVVIVGATGGIKFTLFYFGGIDSPFWDNVSLKVDRSKMLTPQT